MMRRCDNSDRKLSGFVISDFLRVAKYFSANVSTFTAYL